MKKGLTEIVFILDRSGSMGGLESDTIGGFNGMITKQRKEAGEAVVSTVLFDDVCEVLHDRAPMEEISLMTDKDYYVRGCTALLDAVGGAIRHISEVHKDLKKKERPKKTLFVIITDGMENASRVYSYNRVKKMIDHEKNKHGWEFIFIGANIDSIAEAEKFGIDRTRAVDYIHDSEGTAIVYEAVSNAVCKMRMASPSCSSRIFDSGEWSGNIREDHNKRK